MLDRADGPGPSPPEVDDPSAVTLADVARLAGVSSATATRALRGLTRVNPATRARVEEATRTLGYVPHLGARALATRSSQTIGLLIPSTGDSFWGAITGGFEERALAEGFSVLLATSHGDAERERAMIALFLGKRVDGIVIGSAAGMPSTWFPRGRPRTPVVLVDWDTPFEASDVEAATRGPVDDVIARIERRAESPFRHVCTDDVDGGGRAVRHLLELGHRRIAFAGVAAIRPSLLRLLGVRRVLEGEGLDLALAIECEASLEGGLRAGERIVRADPRPSAIVAFDDLVAVGVVRATHAAGLKVPTDLSVVGFDDITVAAFVEPPLTTFAQPKEALGDLAVEVVLDELRGLREATSTRLLGRLVVRQSTAAPTVVRLDASTR
jgi:LacI family transcriptional regulator